MVVDHAYRLHKRVADGLSNKFEAFLFQEFAHSL